MKKKYKLPVERKFSEKISFDSPAHKGQLKNAIDFIVPEGTPVFAIADGIVVDVKDDSNIGGDDVKYWYDGNYVIMKHSEKIYSEYEHFKYKGITVKKGQKVKAGNLIGFAGNTGYSEGPHLHLELRKKTGPGEEDFITIKIEFEGVKKNETNSKTN